MLFTRERIKPLLEKYLGALPANGQEVAAKDLGIHPPEGQVAKAVYKGSEPRATVQLIWSGGFNFSQQENVVLDALKECLEIRLLERLREDESGVYAPSAFASSVKFPQQRYTLGVFFGCGPQNVEKLITSTLDEIAKLKVSGPPQVNVDKWRAESLRQREIALKTNNWWQVYLNDQNINGEDLSAFQQYESQVTAVTPEMVKEMAQKYLSGKNYIRLVLLPEKVSSQ
ncbi:M16 family metallopeptidase [Mucilaginibacter sp.]|uniref:M16 family metallopeptidase n=1 Tax=Mucilaginibacter sp. TaxID=1882438 RepID=UPI003D0ED7D0